MRQPVACSSADVDCARAVRGRGAARCVVAGRQVGRGAVGWGVGARAGCGGEEQAPLRGVPLLAGLGGPYPDQRVQAQVRAVPVAIERRARPSEDTLARLAVYAAVAVGVTGGGPLHGAMQRPGDEAPPCEDGEGEEADDGAHADEDRAGREGRFLHEGRQGGGRDGGGWVGECS